MKSIDPSTKNRKQKLLWILPVFVLPFLTLLFWAMGGGKGTVVLNNPQKGVNLKLPAAQNKEDNTLDKLSYYDQAMQDSLKVDELRKKDPNYRFGTTTQETADSVQGTRPGGGLSMKPLQSPKEEEVYQKLQALQRAISAAPAQRPAEPKSAKSYDTSFRAGESVPLIAPMDAPAQQDPELAQIGGMLENILDIQYPERMEKKLMDASSRERGRVYTIASQEDVQVVASIPTGLYLPSEFARPSTHNGFYTLESQDTETFQDNAVIATIAETQTVVNGSTVKMLLGQDIFINGAKIPKNTFIYGTASLKGERLNVEITNVRYGNSLFPVELAAYDMDGLTGIYIPGAINRDVAKASADRSMQSLGVTTLSDSWGAQAAGAGIEAAKGLFSKKVKLVKVTLKAGYTLLLKDEKQKE